MSSVKSITTQALYGDPSQLNQSVVIDVRTAAEWAYVGVPLAPSVHFIEWLRFPGGVQNGDFAAAVEALGLAKDAPIALLCRSGVRSLYAGQTLTQQGYSDVTNISDGFEGDPDAHGHRNTVNGWRHSGLPWRQS